MFSIVGPPRFWSNYKRFQFRLRRPKTVVQHFRCRFFVLCNPADSRVRPYRGLILLDLFDFEDRWPLSVCMTGDSDFLPSCLSLSLISLSGFNSLTCFFRLLGWLVILNECCKYACCASPSFPINSNLVSFSEIYIYM